MHSLKKLLIEFAKCIFIQIRWFVDYIIDFGFGLYYDSKAQKVPPVKNQLVLESTTVLAKKIR